MKNLSYMDLTCISGGKRLQESLLNLTFNNDDNIKNLQKSEEKVDSDNQAIVNRLFNWIDISFILLLNLPTTIPTTAIKINSYIEKRRAGKTFAKGEKFELTWSIFALGVYFTTLGTNIYNIMQDAKPEESSNKKNKKGKQGALQVINKVLSIMACSFFTYSNYKHSKSRENFFTQNNSDTAKGEDVKALNAEDIKKDNARFQIILRRFGQCVDVLKEVVPSILAVSIGTAFAANLFSNGDDDNLLVGAIVGGCVGLSLYGYESVNRCMK